MKFMLFWSSPWILRTIWMNKFLPGEFHAFRGKMIIIGFGHCHGNFGGKIKLNRIKFILFMVMGTYTLSIDWVAS